MALSPTLTTPNGQTVEVFSRQSLDGLANLQREFPNVAAYVFGAIKGRAVLVHEYKDGTYSNASKL